MLLIKYKSEQYLSAGVFLSQNNYDLVSKHMKICETAAFIVTNVYKVDSD